MVGGGFEPPKAMPADLQSAPFDRFGTPPSCAPETVSFLGAIAVSPAKNPNWKRAAPKLLGGHLQTSYGT